MTDYKRKRLEAELERLQHEWEIRNDKLKHIGKQLAIETSATEKFKLEAQLKQEKIELKKLDQELEAIENLLHSQYGFDQKSHILETFPFEVVTVNAQGKITNRQNHTAKYFAEDLGNGISLKMVQIPGGTFTMGSPESEAERLNRESPQHKVTVPGFFIGKYEITQAQYQAIMGTNPSNFKGDKRPVEQVRWDDAVEFCDKLSQKTGKTYRLPSEAEWEYACRAGTTTPFYFGETITPDLVNYDGNYPYGSAPKGEYREETTNVGIFPPNSFGLYDMCGNIWEWCEDIYNDSYQGAPIDGSAWLRGSDNNIKLLRGGSWDNDARYCRSATRFRYARADRHYAVGFRVVAVAIL